MSHHFIPSRDLLNQNTDRLADQCANKNLEEYKEVHLGNIPIDIKSDAI